MFHLRQCQGKEPTEDIDAGKGWLYHRNAGAFPLQEVVKIMPANSNSFLGRLFAGRVSYFIS